MRKKKQIRRIKNDGLLSRVYEDFKNNQKNREKKEIKFREEQLEKNQEKLKLKRVYTNHFFKDELSLVYRPEFGKNEIEKFLIQSLKKNLGLYI